MSATDDAKAAVTIAKGVLDMAKENPDAQRAGRSFAKSLAVVAETVQTELLPLAAMNYGRSRSKMHVVGSGGPRKTRITRTRSASLSLRPFQLSRLGMSLRRTKSRFWPFRIAASLGGHEIECTTGLVAEADLRKSSDTQRYTQT
jgi:hypothetical protein